MSSALHRRVSVGAIFLVSTLLAGVLGATPAASGEKGARWLTQGSDPVGLQRAIASNSHKLPAEFTSRLRYAENGLLRVIVATSARTPQLESFVAEQTSWVNWYFDNPRFNAAVTPDGLEALLTSPAITFVEPDFKLSYFLSSSTLDIHARSKGNDGAGVWSFDESAGGLGTLRSDVPGLTVDQATGKGVTVAITDSGIDRTHRDFGGWNCIATEFQPCDSRIVKAVTTEHIVGPGAEHGDSLPTTEAASGHGTHVAGIIGGNGYYARDGGYSDDPTVYGGDGTPIGVAPQVNLVMTKNGDSQWAGMSQQGLEWQLENADAFDIRVSSNSWGCPLGCSFNGSSATGQLLKAMYQAGILVTFAAGNDGGTDSGTAFSGNAQSPYVLGVASYNDVDHRLASSSSRGSDKTLPDAATWTPESEPVNGERRPDVGAPGVGIWAARTLTGGTSAGPGRVNVSDVTGGPGLGTREYVSMGGTSMATPHVSGAAALAFSACPAATPLDVMRAIMATAGQDVLKSAGSGLAEPFEVGYGGLEVRAAVDWLLARGCDSNNTGGGDPDPTPTPTVTVTPDPTPTDNQTPPPGGTGKTYYFHSPTGLGNVDWPAFGSPFDDKAPTTNGYSEWHDFPVIRNGPTGQGPYDPNWVGSVDSPISTFKLDFWAKTPVGDLLGEVNYDPTISVGGVQYKLPTLTQAIDPQVGDVPTRLTKTYTTMLNSTGQEIPLAIDPKGAPVTVTIAGKFNDEESGSWIVYDSTDYPSGFSVNGGGSGGVDPTPTETPTVDPTEPPPPPAGRGTYPSNPNDPLFADQWGMAKIQAPQAWQEAQATGYGVKIAIVDSGTDLGHEDFACPGKLQILPGSDVADGDSNPQDEDGHGTHTSGIAGACTNNGKGVVGVAPDSTIMPVRTIGGSGDLDKAMADGIRFATDNGAHVINLSIGDIPPFSHMGAEGYPQTEDAMEHARTNGVVIAAAAGNFAQPTCEYPSLSRNVICVVATDRNDMRAWYTDFPVNVDPNGSGPSAERPFEPVVAAPGGQGNPLSCDEGIVSTYLRSAGSNCYTTGYDSLDGTSMSAPHVAGLAALLYDRIGGQRSAANADLIVNTILETSDDLYTPGWDPIVGYGRINALAAITSLPEPKPTETPTETPTEPESADTQVAFTDNTSGAVQYTDQATVEAQLKDSATGLPIEGAELVFELVGESGAREFRATTDAMGTASQTFTAVEKPGAFTLNVRYAGQEDKYNGSADTRPFVVEKEDSSTTLTASGKSSQRVLTATVTEADEGTPLEGRVVEFFANGTSLGTATTAADGTASFNVPKKQASGKNQYEAVFDNDDFYRRSSGSASG